MWFTEASAIGRFRVRRDGTFIQQTLGRFTTTGQSLRPRAAPGEDAAGGVHDPQDPLAVDRALRFIACLHRDTDGERNTASDPAGCPGAHRRERLDRRRELRGHAHLAAMRERRRRRGNRGGGEPAGRERCQRRGPRHGVRRSLAPPRRHGFVDDGVAVRARSRGRRCAVHRARPRVVRSAAAGCGLAAGVAGSSRAGAGLLARCAG